MLGMSEFHAKSIYVRILVDIVSVCVCFYSNPVGMFTFYLTDKSIFNWAPVGIGKVLLVYIKSGWYNPISITIWLVSVKSV